MRPVDCTRAPHATWTKCRCEDCTPYMQRMAKLQRHGYYRRVSSAAAWEVLDRLRAADWSGRAIGTAAGIPTDTVNQALSHGPTWRWGAHHAAAIVNHGRPTAGQIGAYGASRRLRALAALGWTLDALAARCGVGFSTLAAVRAGTTTRVGVPLAHRIEAVYDELCMVPGPSVPARRHAARAGWAPPLAWDDIDDPDAVPDLGGEEDGRLGVRMEDLEHLVLTDGPWTWQRITARLGVTRSAIQHACARNGRRDLLDRIQSAHAATSHLGAA